VIGAKVRDELFGARTGARPAGARRRPPLPHRRRARLDRPGAGHEHRRTGHRAGVAGAGDVQQQHAVPHPRRGHQPRAIEPAKAQVAEIIKLRHEGEEDVTVITQDAVLATFDRILLAR
jgi:hypothetical protein